MIVYRGNSRCLTCGGQRPADVDLIVDGAQKQYVCPDCDYLIATGVVVHDHDAAYRVDPPDHHDDHEPEIPINTNLGTWEKWWSDRAIVSIIHGRVVAGDEGLADFIRYLEALHDGS